MEREWVIDADMSRDGFLAFCPIKRDSNGEITSIITGMTFHGTEPPNGEKCLGIWSEEGGEEGAGEFARREENRDVLVALGMLACKESV